MTNYDHEIAGTHPLTQDRIKRVEEQIANAKIPKIKAGGLVGAIALPVISATVAGVATGDVEAALKAAADATPVDVLKADSFPNAATRAADWVDPSLGLLTHKMRQGLRSLGYEVEEDETDKETLLKESLADILRVKLENGSIQANSGDKTLSALYENHQNMRAIEKQLETPEQKNNSELLSKLEKLQTNMITGTQIWLTEHGKYRESLAAMDTGITQFVNDNVQLHGKNADHGDAKFPTPVTSEIKDRTPPNAR